MDKGHIRFFYVSDEKTNLCRPCSGGKIRAFKPLTTKQNFLVSGQKARISRPVLDWKRRVFSPLTKKNRIRPLSINKECPKSQFTIFGFASEGNLRAIWAIDDS